MDFTILAFGYANNTTSVVSLLQYCNNVTGNLFGPLILFAIGAITFITLNTSMHSAQQAFVSAAFFVFVISVLFGIMGLVDEYMLFYTLVIMLISLVIIYLKPG